MEKKFGIFFWKNQSSQHVIVKHQSVLPTTARNEVRFYTTNSLKATGGEYYGV
jgi:hypothetical protein